MSSDSASILSMALAAVASKVVIIIGLLMVFGLFCWAMFLHDLIALAVAGAFALVVFLPVLFRLLGASRAKDISSS